MAVTETWLTTSTGDQDLLDFFPAGYNAVHMARLNKRGGGVALIYRDSISVESVHSEFYSPMFEYLVITLRISSICVRLIIVYRPPSQYTKCSEGQFLSDFDDFIQSFVVSTGKLLIAGDFNIHTENMSNPTATKFSSILDSNGMSQHVNGVTHIDGHRLDRVISRQADKLITGSCVSKLIGDHFAIRSFIKAYRPPRPRKTVTYRELDAINDDHFVSDMLALPLFTSPASNASELLAQYNEGLSSLMDTHAPVRKKTVTIRPANPWLNDEVISARRRGRVAERRWRHRKKL